MESATSRHESIFSAALFNPRRVTIAGVGAGGGFVCLGLAKLGVRNIAIYDTDIVTLPNIGPSIYGRKHVGMRKVDACAAIVHDLSDNVEVEACAKPIEDAEQLGTVVFLCVDDMEVRKKIVLDCASVHTAHVHRIIEGRMGALFAQAFSIDPHNAEHREDWLRYWFPQGAAESGLPGCGAHPVSLGPVASVVANFMVLQFMQWWAHARGGDVSIVNEIRFDAESMQTDPRVW